MPYKDKNKNRKYQREWARRNRAVQKRYFKKIRKRVIEMLGGKCVYCGCDNFDALEINHIHGGGRAEKRRRKFSTRGFLLAIINGSRKTDDLELTCRVCNAYHYLKEIKGLEGDWYIQWLGVIIGVPAKAP